MRKNLMGVLHVRNQLISRLNDLDDEQIAALLAFLKVIHPGKSQQDYDETNDPILNGELSFSGAPDLAERSEDILQAEMGDRRDLNEQDT